MAQGLGIITALRAPFAEKSFCVINPLNYICVLVGGSLIKKQVLSLVISTYVPAFHVQITWTIIIWNDDSTEKDRKTLNLLCPEMQ